MNTQETDDLKILVLAIGNSGRSDDGLGWRLGDMVTALNLHEVTVEYRYQLQVEDAQFITQFEVVIFADATEQQIDKGFSFSKCIPANTYFYSSHRQSPETVLYLSNELYGKFPEAWVLAISGYYWELGEGLSNHALQNVVKAFEAIKRSFKTIKKPNKPQIC
jgi:hydrogenase maturation protease